MTSENLPWDDPFIAPLLVLWLYLPGYLSNTAAMLGGKWIPDLTGIPVFTIDGGAVMSDGNRVLGDGKTWNGLIGGTIGGGLLGILLPGPSFNIWNEFFRDFRCMVLHRRRIDDGFHNRLCAWFGLHGRRLGRVFRQAETWA
jgi:hypothetical protein